jgi:hypothetical protein
MTKIEILMSDGKSTSFKDIFKNDMKSYKITHEVSEALYNIFLDNLGVEPSVTIREDLNEYASHCVTTMMRSKTTLESTVIALKSDKICGGAIIWYGEEIKEKEMINPIKKLYLILRSKYRKLKRRGCEK